jgi:branched-chain amino acid transport system substrate-binding protein
MKKIAAAIVMSAVGYAYALSMPALAADPVKIAVIQDATGSAVLEDYAKQVYRGFDLGIDFATKGTKQVLGRPIEILRKDTNVKPDRARALLAESYQQGAVLAVGSTSSGVTKAMLSVAADNEKILLVAPAVADSITGADWNKYIFKSSRNNSFDMQAQVIAMRIEADTAIGVIGEDYAFVRDGVAALKEALGPKASAVIAEEYVPANAADLTPALERIAARMSSHKGRKILFGYFGFLPNYMGKIANWGPERKGLEVSAISLTLPMLETYKAVPGMQGGAFYYYELPKNATNDWLVAEHKKRFNGEPPDFFTVEGFTAAVAVVTALEKAKSTDTDKLIAAMEGMPFDSPRGRMWFRAEDHQAMMPMYHVKMTTKPDVAWAVPELIREIPPAEFNIPIRNKR